MNGLMSTWPWFEDRGPNPFLLATGQVRSVWERGHFWDWFALDQAPVLVEPLVKFLRPIIYFFSAQADGWTRFYFFCAMVWTLAVWSLFGGAITRIAAVQIARNERIGMSEALRFTMKRLVYYVTAPLFPLVFVGGLLIVMIIFGYFHMIPIFGDIVVDGLMWWLMMGFGLLMAIALVGLIGWPLMAATISTEGTDSWEAVSRSYTYVFQKPWHYIWYSLVAISYGAVVVFFIGFMGSFMVYLSKWGVSQTFGIKKADREPSFLFAYAPTSFGWRTLLLEGVEVDGEKIVQNGVINERVYNKYVGKLPAEKKDNQLRLVEQVRRRFGGDLGGPVVPARARVRLQFLLEFRDDHLFADAQESRYGGDGRGVPGRGRPGGGLRRSAGAARRRAESIARPGGCGAEDNAVENGRAPALKMASLTTPADAIAPAAANPVATEPKPVEPAPASCTGSRSDPDAIQRRRIDHAAELTCSVPPLRHVSPTRKQGVLT